MNILTLLSINSLSILVNLAPANHNNPSPRTGSQDLLVNHYDCDLLVSLLVNHYYEDHQQKSYANTQLTR